MFSSWNINFLMRNGDETFQSITILIHLMEMITWNIVFDIFVVAKTKLLTKSTAAGTPMRLHRQMFLTLAGLVRF